MLRILILLYCLALLPVSCQNKKGASSVRVYDQEQVLTPDQITSLDSLYKVHEKLTGNEIALVTTAKLGGDTSMMEFAVYFGRMYGIGKKGINNGVIIAFSNTLRQTAIATGYGTEDVLKDEIAKRIIDSVMIPNFKAGRIFEGLWEGSLAVSRFLEQPGNKIR